MYIDLSKYIPPSKVRVYEGSPSKSLVLEKIAGLVSLDSDSPQRLKQIIFDSLQSREMLGSTGLTRGLALPHCRVPCISDFIMGILVFPEGVVYGSLDGKLSRVFVFVIAPEESQNDYLNIMAEIGAFLSKENYVEILAECKEDAFLYQSFLKLWEKHIGENKKQS